MMKLTSVKYRTHIKALAFKKKLLIICSSHMPINKILNDFAFYVINIHFEVKKYKIFIVRFLYFYIFSIWSKRPIFKK